MSFTIVQTKFRLNGAEFFIHYLHKYHNTVHLGGLFALKQWISCSLKHDTVPRVNNLHCFYVKNPPRQIALWYCASCVSSFSIFRAKKFETKSTFKVKKGNLKNGKMRREKGEGRLVAECIKNKILVIKVRLNLSTNITTTRS